MFPAGVHRARAAPPPAAVESARLLVGCEPGDARFELRRPEEDAVVAAGDCGTAVQVPPGRYQVRVQAPGRTTHAALLDLSPGMNAHAVHLANAPEARGRSLLQLEVKETDIADAPPEWPLGPPLRIQVDGEEHSREDLARGVELYPGVHEVVIVAGQQTLWSRRVRLPGPPQELSLRTTFQVSNCQDTITLQDPEAPRRDYQQVEPGRVYPLRPMHAYTVQCGSESLTLRVPLGGHFLAYFPAAAPRWREESSAVGARALASGELAVLGALGTLQHAEVRLALGLIDRRFGPALAALELGMGVGLRPGRSAWLITPVVSVRSRVYDRGAWAVAILATFGGAFGGGYGDDFYKSRRRTVEVNIGLLATVNLPRRFSLTGSAVLVFASDRLCPTDAAHTIAIEPASQFCQMPGALDRKFIDDYLLRLTGERQFLRASRHRVGLFAQLEGSLRDVRDERDLYKDEDPHGNPRRTWMNYGLRASVGVVWYPPRRGMRR